MEIEREGGVERERKGRERGGWREGGERGREGRERERKRG